MQIKEAEEKILEFWKKEKIYEKSKKRNSSGKKFYMMDGPPYATGNIHLGTALNKILKDIAMRSHRLQGFDVFDRAGYDTHGVPIEFKVEKEIGSKSKKDIEKFGIKKFIEKCKEFATKYIDVMNREFVNLGVWMDFENPYLTLSEEYVEAIWETFKIAEEKGLLYLGKYPVHVCPRCETAVAFNEIEYEKQKDTSIFVKFPLKNKKNTFLIIWTTTPWTLPANTGVMVHPDFDYQELEISNGERWIIAKELVPKLMAEIETGYTPKGVLKGKDMQDWEYINPLYKNIKLKPKNSYRVVLSGRYVNLEEGTGLVHAAPGHGKEDYEVGKETKLDMLSPVEINGTLTKDAGKYAGKKARIVDKEIIEDLEKDNYLVYKKEYEHDYPACWRCKSPLLMLSLPQWFLKISKIQKKILKENKEVNWIPSWMELRMKAWLEGLSDWPISRERYWGTPLPIWVCETCETRKVLGSKKEIEKLSGQKLNDVHKPEIDKIEIECDCGRKMKRVSGVLDVWFDSGVSSWAALRKNKKDGFEKYWPADLNIEGKDQIRGWWNSQYILSEIRFGKKPFESIMEHGMILDLGKKKMSKSVGNVVTPAEIIEKYGRDVMRYYLAKSSKGEDFSFDEEELKKINKIFLMLSNINKFVNQTSKKKSKLKKEDEWILSKYYSLIKKITKNYRAYKYPEVIKEFEEFLINDLSRNYIKIIRERTDEVYEILNKIRVGLIKLIAPICPFTSENLWQELRNEKKVEGESVHLSDWPEKDGRKIDSELEAYFEEVLKIIELGLRERDKNQIGLRWPLSKVFVFIKGANRFKDIEEIIKSQLNVKTIEFKSPASKETELEVELDTTITPELEAEGYAREVSRKVQGFRKDLGLVKEDIIELQIVVDKEFQGVLEKNKNMIQERTNSKIIKIVTTEEERFKNVLDFNIKEKRGKIYVKKLA